LLSYRRGRQAFTRARGTREMEDLHAWRKRVKDLWYHERLLASTCGPTVRGHAKDLDRLSDLLGDDHDLAVLRQEPAPVRAPTPKAFRRRLRGSWKAGRALARAPRASDPVRLGAPTR
jgi:CHAD domain-containing protein